MIVVRTVRLAGNPKKGKKNAFLREKNRKATTEGRRTSRSHAPAPEKEYKKKTGKKQY